MNELYFPVNIITFLIIKFILGFISDGFLNLFSQKFKSFSSLKPYFKHYGTLPAMIYAGLTVMIVGLIMITFYAAITKQFGKLTINVHSIYFLILSFLFGFIFDIIINKAGIFGNLLDKYYYAVTDIGSAILGGLALLFTTFISLSIIYIVEKIKKRKKRN